MFNKYQFIRDLKESIISESVTESNLQDFIHEYIDNECIYYADCFDIIKELHFTHFEHDIFGMCDNVSKAAYCALYDLIEEHYSELLESLTEEA